VFGANQLAVKVKGRLPVPTLSVAGCKNRNRSLGPGAGNMKVPLCKAHVYVLLASRHPTAWEALLVVPHFNPTAASMNLLGTVTCSPPMEFPVARTRYCKMMLLPSSSDGFVTT